MFGIADYGASLLSPSLFSMTWAGQPGLDHLDQQQWCRLLAATGVIIVGDQVSCWMAVAGVATLLAT
jgi:hypothetical protein